MNAKQFPKQPGDPASKFVGGAMGLIFAGIGVTTLAFLWGVQFGRLGAPPLFFRVFGSFIALSFVIVGGAVFLRVMRGMAASGDDPASSGENAESTNSPLDDVRENPPPAYNCPQCGAPLREGAEVSPHGDVKCAYCNAWFNIHHCN